MNKKIIRIATRKSKLALWQANWIKNLIEEQHPNVEAVLVGVVTDGDKEQSLPLTEIGGKSVFVKTLQNALINNEADIAVHCVKDMSVHPVEDLILAAICKREDPRDAFISNHAKTLDTLKQNPIIGTGSPRRSSLIKSLRPDATIKLLRGNVDTRLAKLDNGEYDAIILATAGLNRLGLSHRIQSHLAPDIFTPAIGQGAIAIECRRTDIDTKNLVSFLHNETTAQCISAEKTVNQRLNGDCHTPIGAYASITDGTMQLQAVVGSLDGKTILRSSASGSADHANALGETVAIDLQSQGADEFISK